MNKKENVIPQVRMLFKAEGRANLFDMLRRIKTYARQTITQYGTGSVLLFNYAESPKETITEGDSVQANSHDTFLSRFVLLYGMTTRI